MRAVVLAGLALGACSFRGANPQDGVPDARPDAPAGPAVRFVSIEPSVTELRPGLYGFEIVAVLRNELEVGVDAVAVTLTFADDTTDRASDFRWRSADRREGAAVMPPATTIPAGGEATYRFTVDALPWAAPPGPILVNGAATFTTGEGTESAVPLAAPHQLPFATLAPPIVVNRTGDESNGDNSICLREAIAIAAGSAGPDRIVFDPAVFPPGSATASVLSPALGPLPVITEDLVIDGHGAGFVLALGAGWENLDGNYGLRLSSGTLVVHDLGFRNMGFQYLNEGNLDPPSSANCGSSGAQLEGGAIYVSGGTLVLDGNRFSDPDVAERNCYAASVRLHGGTGHRILFNEWTEQSMDSIYVDAAVLEIAGNVMTAASNPSKADECIYIASQRGVDLWIVGNLCVDQEFSGIYAGSGDAGVLYVVNNTFARNGRSSLAAIRRSGGRMVRLRNNVYLANNPAALEVDANGAGFDIAYEASSNNAFCNSCTSATIDMASMTMPSNLQLADPNGTTLAAFIPLPSSPLVGTGLAWLDRNGSAPGYFGGSGTERGAVELP